MAKPKQNKKEMKDILILYEQTDSEEWATFIHTCFSGCPQSLTIEAKDLKTKLTEVGEFASRFSMILVIVSNEMLKTMVTRTVMCILDPLLQNHPCVSVIKLYIEQELFANKVKLRYHGTQSWKCISVGSNDGEDHVLQLISEIIDILQNVTVPAMQAPPIPDSVPDPVPDSVPDPVPDRRNKIIQSVCPEYIRQGGERMMVVLRTAIKDGQCVQINIGGENEMKIDTDTLNQYCFTFKAPAHKAGPATLRLYIDGKKRAKMKVHYSTMNKFAYSCPEYLCQLIGLNPNDKAGLDKELMHIFNASSPQDGSLQFLLSPKNLQAVSSTGTTESVGELPTLLHFACRYGLNDLVVSVLNTPGSHIAIGMDNDRGMNPLDLAREANNDEIVHYLESYADMHDYVTDIELIYEHMSGGKPLDAYMNTGTYSGTAKPKYVDMKCVDAVEEAYIEGRLPGGSDSDYEGMDMCTGFVEEVKEEDDVRPEIPKRKRSVNLPSEIPDISDNLQGSMQDNRVTSGSMPKDDLFGDCAKLPLSSMGSLNLDDLSQYAEAYKRKEFSMEDIERLHKAWRDRNRDMSSHSIKEHNKQLDDMRETYSKVLKTQQKKTSFLPWMKKVKRPEIAIQHNVQPNQYEPWKMEHVNLHPTANRDSTISNTSTTSSSSASSHDSYLGTLVEDSRDSDASNNVTGGNVTPRRKTNQRSSNENRESWGNQFLNTPSRLPKPPPQNPVYVTHKLPLNTDVPAQPPRPPKPGGLAPAQPPRPPKPN